MRRSTCLLSLLILSLLATATAETAPRPVVGVTLEGGGALGLAHVGVLQWMEEHHVPVDRIDGTSMGALIGGLYATGHSPAEIRKLAISNVIPSVFTLETPYTSANFRRRQDRREMPHVFTVALKSRYGLRNALLTDSGLNNLLSREFLSYNTADLDFDTLPTPFRCVATDLTTLEPVTFRSGPMPQAVRSSVSIPGVFSPVQAANGDFLVDGGILDNLPTGVMRRELHADVVIAVHLELGKLSAADTGSIVNVLNRAFSAGVARNENQSKALADVLLNVPLGSFSSMDYDKALALIDAGYKTAEANREALLRYALPESEWDQFQAARAARMHPAPGLLRAVHVEGGDPGAQRAVERDLKTAEGEPVTPARMNEALRPVQADGEYTATYQLFQAPGGGEGVKVSLDRQQGGPPYLLVGPDAFASTSNVSRGLLNMRLVHQSLGGYGSEFSATARLGYLTDVGADYYRLLTPQGYFVDPEVRVLRQPVYIWANQKRIAERFQQNLEAGVAVGRTFSSSLQVAAQWRGEDTRWSLRTGSDGGGYVTGTAQTAQMRVALDRTLTDSISPSGVRFVLSAGALYHAVGSENAPLLHVSFDRALSLSRNNLLGFSGDIHSYLRARVADPFRFTLGGPLRLSASSYDEYRGTDTGLVRAGLMHRLAPLPTGLGQGLYAVTGYEAGEIWSPERPAILRQDGILGLVAATPVGVISFGGAVGDAGHRKIFFTLGRWF